MPPALALNTEVGDPSRELSKLRPHSLSPSLVRACVGLLPPTGVGELFLFMN